MSHPWDWDFLIHRHLAGDELTEEQRTALNERLRKFPRLRKRLAEMAFEQANLRDALTVSEAVPILIVPEPAPALESDERRTDNPVRVALVRLRATFRWKIPYTTKFFTRVGRWSHRGSFRCAVNRYRRRRYIFRPKIERETTRKAVTAIVSKAVAP